MFELSQETIAIVTVGIALAGLDITSDNSIRDEIQTVRDEGRANRDTLCDEARADREMFRSEMQTLRDETRSEREAFEKHITRPTQEQSRLTGIVEQIRTRPRRPRAGDSWVVVYGCLLLRL